MHRSYWVAALVAGALCAAVLPAAEPAAAHDTRKLLSKLTSDLEDMWQNYATDKQKDTRERALQQYSQQFQKDVKNAGTPDKQTMQRAVNDFIENMGRSNSIFRLEKMKTTRTAYQQACSLAFKQEFPSAKDYAKARDTQKVFELDMQWLEQARDGLLRANDDCQSLAYNTINEACTTMLQKATIPEGDSLAQFDRNLKDARRRFSIATSALKATNGRILTMLEARAKDAQQRAATKK